MTLTKLKYRIVFLNNLVPFKYWGGVSLDRIRHPNHGMLPLTEPPS